MCCSAPPLPPPETIQLALRVGAASLEALSGLNPLWIAGDFNISTFVCSQPGWTPGGESKNHRMCVCCGGGHGWAGRRFQLTVGKKGGDTCLEPSDLSPPLHRPSSQSWKLLSRPLKSQTGSFCGLWPSVWGSSRILQSLLVYAIKDLGSFPFHLMCVSLPCYPLSVTFPRGGESSSWTKYYSKNMQTGTWPPAPAPPL